MRAAGQPSSPLFLADWRRALFIHFAVAPTALQPRVPFALDLFDGLAYVSLVAFTQAAFRPVRGGRLAARFSGWIANHTFLNLRTYVRSGDMPGIFFLAEWIPNRLDALLGPRTYGLPYRLGALAYDHDHESGRLTGRVDAAGGSLEYRAAVAAPYQPCAPGSLDEFLLERYAAFTRQANVCRCFQIAHEPWPSSRVSVQLLERTLCDGALPGLPSVCAAHYSPGARDVLISPPRRLSEEHP